MFKLQTRREREDATISEMDIREVQYRLEDLALESKQDDGDWSDEALGRASIRVQRRRALKRRMAILQTRAGGGGMATGGLAETRTR